MEREFENRVKFVIDSQQALANDIDRVWKEIEALKTFDSSANKTDELLRKSELVSKKLEETMQKYERIKKNVTELENKELAR